jgi:hypothetical protein
MLRALFPPDKPLLLRYAPLVLGLWGAGFCILFPLALLDIGHFTIDERTVSGPEFAARAYPVVLPCAVMAVALAAGFYGDRSWTRPLALTFCASLAVGSSAVGFASGATVDASIVLLSAPLWLGALFWYLYGKAAVVAYYNRISDGTASGEANSA